jgi:hypothetical protein
MLVGLSSRNWKFRVTKIVYWFKTNSTMKYYHVSYLFKNIHSTSSGIKLKGLRFIRFQLIWENNLIYMQTAKSLYDCCINTQSNLIESAIQCVFRLSLSILFIIYYCYLCVSCSLKTNDILLHIKYVYSLCLHNLLSLAFQFFIYH